MNRNAAGSSPATPPDPSADSPRQLQRAARLLDAVRKALNHDLPNHLVAIQGLLHVLELDEAGRFSPEGHDYLRRIRTATKRAQDMVATLKDLCRLAGEAAAPEPLQLADALEEVRAAINQLFPTHVIEYHFHLEAGEVCAARRTFYQALLQMARVLVTSAGPGLLRLDARSRAVPDGVELTLRLSRRAGAPADAAEPAATEYSLAQRLDVVLARELADCSGTRLIVAPDNGGLVLTLTAPAV
jgi:hypothetical protein